MSGNPFKVFDYVRLRRGHTRMVVTKVSGSIVNATYQIEEFEKEGHGQLSSSACKIRNYSNFVTWDGDEAETEEEYPGMAKLYQWHDDDSNVVFGDKIGVNRDGYWIMDPKGGGQPYVVKAEHVTEVLPYTVKVQFLVGKVAPNDKHPLSGLQDGDVEVGDVLFLPKYMAFVVVEETDTKHTGNAIEVTDWKKVAFR